MTNAELKAAMKSRKPVIYRSARYGESRYKRIYAIRYTLDESDNIISQAELLDYNNNSINTVKGSEVFLDND
ncbi:MAG: hypothetical protein HFE79_12620 [Ruminiclostridium sp.]|nr:hypothetical protein [Ruminiclostridium sp.]